MDKSSGGTTLFMGSVRDHNEDHKVSQIFYEAYKEMAEETLHEIETEVRKRWNITKFIVVHRIGLLEAGEISIAIAVSSEHRKGAFEACNYCIEEIKKRVPIWKKEVSEFDEAWVEGISLKGD
jgi:molybdopterin synthase catalytic subunit